MYIGISNYSFSFTALESVDALLTMGFDFYITEGSDLKIPSFDERIAQLQEYDRLQRNIPRDAGPGFRG